MQKGTVIVYDGARGKTYRIQYRDASGRQVKETLRGVTSKREAEAELADRISRVANKHYRRPKPVTFKDFARTWLEDSQGPEGWSPATIRKYEATIKQRLSPHFGHYKLREIRRSHVKSFLGDLINPDKGNLAPRTANLVIVVLHAILQEAIERDLLEANVASGVRAKEREYKPRALTADEAQIVRAHLKDPQVKLAFLTFELLGLRWHELTGLRWKDVDFVESRLRVDKSKSEAGERWLAIPSVLLSELALHKNRTLYARPENYVFCHSALGSKWRSEQYREEVHAAIKAAGISDRFRPSHDLRVTSLTEGALAGEGEAVLMARAGHRSFATTKRYLDLAGVVFRDEAEKLAARRLGQPVQVES
jgi:integrase